MIDRPTTTAGEELLASIYVLISQAPNRNEIRGWSLGRILAIEQEAAEVARRSEIERLRTVAANLNVWPVTIDRLLLEAEGHIYDIDHMSEEDD